MKANTRDNVAKFFYDCAKIRFAVLVIGVLAHKPFATNDLMWGIGFTLTLFTMAVIINQTPTSEEMR